MANLTRSKTKQQAGLLARSLWVGCWSSGSNLGTETDDGRGVSAGSYGRYVEQNPAYRFVALFRLSDPAFHSLLPLCNSLCSGGLSGFRRLVRATLYPS